MNMHKFVFHIFLPEAISKAVPVNSLLCHFLTLSIIFFFLKWLDQKGGRYDSDNNQIHTAHLGKSFQLIVNIKVQCVNLFLESLRIFLHALRM